MLFIGILESPHRGECMAEQQRFFRSKFGAALLALTVGTVGIQHWYLGRRYAWLVSLVALILLVMMLRAELWWDSVAFWVLGLFFSAAAIESVCLCLIKDSRFDAWYNPNHKRSTHSGVALILLAIVASLTGAIISMAWLAHVVFRVYHYMGWLEGLNY